MPDYLSIPRQRGLSETPMYETNPRKFARTRCEKAMNACDRIILYMGELIQTYSPEGMLPTDAMKEGLELSAFCAENGIDLNALIDLSQTTQDLPVTLGKFAGYIALAALLMNTATDLRNTLADLKSTI